MVESIHLGAVSSVQEKNSIPHPPSISTGLKSIDTIRFGKNEPNIFMKGYQKTKDFLHWLYMKIRGFLSTIFPCINCLKMEETSLERYQRVYKHLDSCLTSFEEKKKRVEMNELKQWWKKTFHSFDSDMQIWILMEDAKDYDSESDTESSDEEKYEKNVDFAMKFVVELHSRDDYDPLEYVPGYLEAVKEHLQEKIKKLEEGTEKK